MTFNALLALLATVVLSVAWGIFCIAHMGIGPGSALACIIGGGIIGGACAFTQRRKA